MLHVFLFLLLSVTVHTLGVIFEDCGSAYELTLVDIEGCSLQLPCYITSGENVTVTVMFYADFESRNLEQDVILNINYINLKAHVTPEPCASLECPVKTNAVTSFSSMMTVPSKIALNQRGYLQWQLFNEHDQQVICYSVLVQTQSRLQKLYRDFLLSETTF